MEHKCAYVVDKDGFPLPNVYVLVEFQPNPEPDGEPEYFEQIHGGRILGSDESLVYEHKPESYVKPRWTGMEWEETATPDEIKADAYLQLQKQVNMFAPEGVIHEQVLEHIRTQKLAGVGSACEQAIYAGTTAQTSEGEKSFSLQAHDQTELMGLKPSLDALVEAGTVDIPAIPYHADKELCRLWTAQDFASILSTATGYIFWNRTYCNHLNTWIRRETDLDVLQGIDYGSELPQDLAEHMDTLLTAGEGA